MNSRSISFAPTSVALATFAVLFSLRLVDSACALAAPPKLPPTALERIAAESTTTFPGVIGGTGLLENEGFGDAHLPGLAPGKPPSVAFPKGTAIVAFGQENARLCEWDVAKSQCLRTVGIHVTESGAHQFHLRRRGDELWVLFGTTAIDDVELRVYGAEDLALRRKTIVGRGEMLSFEVDANGAVVVFEDALGLQKPPDPECRSDKGPCSPQVKQVVVRLGADLHVHARTWFESWGALGQHDAESVATLGNRAYVVVPWWNARHVYALSLDTLAVTGFYEGKYLPNHSCMPSCWSEVLVHGGRLVVGTQTTIDVLDPDLRLRAKYDGGSGGRLVVDPSTGRVAAGTGPVQVADASRDGRVPVVAAGDGARAVGKAWVYGLLLVVHRRIASSGRTSTWITRFEPAAGKLSTR